MDDRLERLRRGHEASPGDVELARRYEAELLRSGERAAVQELYRFKFQCPLSFLDDLHATSPFTPDIRSCDQCRKQVHYVRSAEALRRCAERGLCVAIDPRLVDSGEVLIESAEVHPAQETTRPFCVVEAADELIPSRDQAGMLGMIVAPYDHPAPLPDEVPPELEPEPPAGLVQRALGLFKRSWWS